MARILIVEDDESTRTLVRSALKKGGHRTLDTGSAEEALEAVGDREPPDVAVLDVQLPGIDGYALAEELRRATGAPDLPVIFLSAGVEERDIERGQAFGAVYLTKPFVGNALLNAIDRVLPGDAEDW